MELKYNKGKKFISLFFIGIMFCGTDSDKGKGLEALKNMKMPSDNGDDLRDLSPDPAFLAKINSLPFRMQQTIDMYKEHLPDSIEVAFSKFSICEDKQYKDQVNAMKAEEMKEQTLFLSQVQEIISDNDENGNINIQAMESALLSLKNEIANNLEIIEIKITDIVENKNNIYEKDRLLLDYNFINRRLVKYMTDLLDELSKILKENSQV